MREVCFLASQDRVHVLFHCTTEKNSMLLSVLLKIGAWNVLRNSRTHSQSWLQIRQKSRDGIFEVSSLAYDNTARTNCFQIHKTAKKNTTFTQRQNKSKLFVGYKQAGKHVHTDCHKVWTTPVSFPIVFKLSETVWKLSASYHSMLSTHVSRCSDQRPRNQTT